MLYLPDALRYPINNQFHKKDRPNFRAVFSIQNPQCGEGDLNPHGIISRQPLKLVCLPIPPPPLLSDIYYTIPQENVNYCCKHARTSDII
jgi:hypothetical protein